MMLLVVVAVLASVAGSSRGLRELETLSPRASSECRGCCTYFIRSVDWEKSRSTEVVNEAGEESNDMENWPCSQHCIPFYTIRCHLSRGSFYIIRAICESFEQSDIIKCVIENIIRCQNVPESSPLPKKRCGRSEYGENVKHIAFWAKGCYGSAGGERGA